MHASGGRGHAGGSCAPRGAAGPPGGGGPANGRAGARACWGHAVGGPAMHTGACLCLQTRTHTVRVCEFGEMHAFKRRRRSARSPAFTYASWGGHHKPRLPSITVTLLPSLLALALVEGVADQTRRIAGDGADARPDWGGTTWRRQVWGGWQWRWPGQQQQCQRGERCRGQAAGREQQPGSGAAGAKWLRDGSCLRLPPLAHARFARTT